MNTANTKNNTKYINKEILRIALPAALETLFTTMTAIIDSKMVSAMGLSAIAAISVTNQPKLFVLCAFFAVNITISSLIAKYQGKQDRESANRIAVTSLVFVAGVGLLLSLLCVIFAKPIMILCSNQQDTLDASILYFRIIMGFMLFNVVSMAINAVFRGYGNTKLTLISNIVSCIVNILLNYMLIEGHWGAPALGIKGAAIATVAGTAAAMAISLAFAFRKSSFVNVQFCLQHKIRPSRSAVMDICEMWKRIFAEDVFTRIGLLLTGIIAARAGSFAMSVYSVSMHLLNVNFALGNGLSSAAITLVGRSFGAEDMESIRTYSGQILKFGTMSSLFLTAVYILFSETYFRFFDNDPHFVQVGMISCVIIGIIAPIQARQIIYNGMFKALGDVKYTLRVSIISVTFVDTIISFVGTILLHGGIWGIWAGAFACQTVRMLLLHHRYKHRIKGGEII